VFVVCLSLGAATLAHIPPTLNEVGDQWFILFALCGQLHSIALAMRRFPVGCLRRLQL
jgi:hypothetical protein